MKATESSFIMLIALILTLSAFIESKHQTNKNAMKSLRQRNNQLRREINNIKKSNRPQNSMNGMMKMNQKKLQNIMNNNGNYQNPGYQHKFMIDQSNFQTNQMNNNLRNGYNRKSQNFVSKFRIWVYFKISIN